MIQNDVEKIKNSYAKNEEIKGEYDVSLSVKCFNGIFVGKKNENVIAFKGIPFAKQPLGDLRWKKPEKVEPCDKVYQAFNFGKSPIQTEWKTERASYYKQGEDCLYLNVWVNTSDTSTNKTVMVFFHGGSYGWGGTSDPIYDGENFVKAHQDIILITVGYRTGIMGFVDLSYLEGGEEYPDAPNLGIYDQIEALRWINENISSFGGNKDNITIFGESAGGGSVSLLPIIDEAKGLFNRVICESGNVALTFSKQECKLFTDLLIKETQAQSVADLLKMSEEELKVVNEKLNQYNNFPQRDGKLIPLNPYASYENGETKDIDLLIGTNANESNYWIGESGGFVPYMLTTPIKFENDLKALNIENKKRVKTFLKNMSGYKLWKMSEFYNEVMFRLPAISQADKHSNNGGKTFMYYWTEQSKIKYRKACHAVELAYVFGNIDDTIFTGERVEEKFSSEVQNMWVNFAKCGNPSTDKIIWDEYSEKERKTMVLCKDYHMDKNILSLQREVLSPLLDEFINPSYVDLNYNVPFVWKSIGLAALILGLVTLGIILLIKFLG